MWPFLFQRENFFSCIYVKDRIEGSIFDPDIDDFLVELSEDDQSKSVMRSCHKLRFGLNFLIVYN